MASFYRGIFISCVQSTLGDFPSEQRGRSWSKAIPCLPGHCGRLGLKEPLWYQRPLPFWSLHTPPCGHCAPLQLLSLGSQSPLSRPHPGVPETDVARREARSAFLPEAGLG